MFDCIWTYSDYRRVNRIEKPNNGKSKIQGSAEVLVAKKVKNITKPTITFPRHIFCLSSQYKPSFIVQFSIIYIYFSLWPKNNISRPYPILSSLIQVSFPVSVRLFSFFSLIPRTDLIVHPPHTTTKKHERLKHHRTQRWEVLSFDDGRKWWQMEEEEAEEEGWGVFTVTVRVQRSSYNHICCHYEHSF